ncbi:translation initiation factor IF-3 [candidate division WOR-1 bacterium RIFCSPLOWO2_02_FULL_46_20]|uniref:Translation initiation factor IF-3 n=2 Tax=Saganbacteria TaxID=1703751 RepID=A0A1F4R4L6_UNCSA|nr:MAG: translation initiation factor IF-3 [candidate division WOR-1 bacterium RIFCSPLOWO2_02_FULL_46_20]OGC08053.1 MAG: translation initiation factor IF-3 [candidate division WOR-1 bacterium RIFCSPLOWO2_12_FULL_45_9]
MKHYIINERIRGTEVRVIDEEGKQLGIVQTVDAVRLANERGLDLVLVSPAATPPVCRIADIGKLKYEESKKEKVARKGQKGGDIKELKLSPKIAQHDFEVRVKKAREFLEKRDKVKISMFFRGRWMAHVDLGMQTINKMIEAVAELGKPEGAPKRFGKNFIVIIAPK